MSVSRRSFLKGSIGGVLAILVPVSAASSKKLLAEPDPQYLTGNIRTVAGQILVPLQTIERTSLDSVKYVMKDDLERIAKDTAKSQGIEVLGDFHWRQIPQHQTAAIILQRYAYAA